MRLLLQSALVAFACALPVATAFPANKTSYTLRGKPQDVYFLAAKGQPKPYSVLFMPGDGGWRGYSVDIAEKIAAMGYNVYGFDVKTYLTSFTGVTTLTESEMGEDLRTVIRWVHEQSGQPVAVSGWSQGANMAVLGASVSKGAPHCIGVLAIGLVEEAVLGWRFVDNITYITKQMPNEPTFSAFSSLRGVSPLPFVMISSSGDEYIKPEQTKSLLDAAGEPKMLRLIRSQNHRFGDNQEGFKKALEEGLSWIYQKSQARLRP